MLFNIFLIIIIYIILIIFYYFYQQSNIQNNKIAGFNLIFYYLKIITVNKNA